LHSEVPNRIWTAKERVYGHSPAGKSEGFAGWETPSLQQGFCGYGQTGLPVAVDDEAAVFAPEQGVVGRIVSLPRSTAARAPFARVPAIDDVQRNMFVEAPRFEVPSESIEWDPHHLAVEPFPLGAETFEVLDGDVGVILESEIGDVSDDLPYPVLHEVVLPGLCRFELPLCGTAPGIGERPEHALPFEDTSASLPDILSEIELPQDLPLRREDSDGKALAVDVDPEDVLPSAQNGIRLGKVCHDLQDGSQSERLADPSTPEKATEPVPVPVCPDWDCDSSSWIEPEFDESESSGLERLAVARDVELHGHALDARASLRFPPNASREVADHLNVESRQPFGFGTDTTPEVVELLIIHSFRKKPVGLGNGGLYKYGKNTLFSRSSLCLKKDSALHSPNRYRSKETKYLTPAASLLPPVNGVGFRSER
jgi:hypothetical protein